MLRGYRDYSVVLLTMSVPMSFMVFQFEFLRLGIKAVSVWARLIFYSPYVWRRATVDGKCLVQWSMRIMHTRRIRRHKHVRPTRDVWQFCTLFTLEGTTILSVAVRSRCFTSTKCVRSIDHSKNHNSQIATKSLIG